MTQRGKHLNNVTFVFGLSCHIQFTSFSHPDWSFTNGAQLSGTHTCSDVVAFKDTKLHSTGEVVASHASLSLSNTSQNIY